MDKLFLMNIDSMEVEENAQSLGQKLRDERDKMILDNGMPIKIEDFMDNEQQSIIEKLNETIRSLEIYTGQNYTFVGISSLVRQRRLVKYPVRNSIRPIRYWCDKMVYYRGEIIGMLKRKNLDS